VKPYIVSSRPDVVVLQGELDYNINDTPAAILKRLKKIAEEIGADIIPTNMVDGGTITVYPPHGACWYVLHVKRQKKKLKITMVETFARIDLLDLADEENKKKHIENR
jgi:hypothetical protein